MLVILLKNCCDADGIFHTANEFFLLWMLLTVIKMPVVMSQYS